MVDHFHDTGIDDHLGTEQARAESGVKGRSFDHDAVIGGLDDGIFFGMTAKTFGQV